MVTFWGQFADLDLHQINFYDKFDKNYLTFLYAHNAGKVPVLIPTFSGAAKK
jgi:hypothetical protein